MSRKASLARDKGTSPGGLENRYRRSVLTEWVSDPGTDFMVLDPDELLT